MHCNMYQVEEVHVIERVITVGSYWQGLLAGLVAI